MNRKNPNRFPPGWDERRVREILDHYENQTDEEAAAEDEAFYRRAEELRRQNLTEAEIEVVLAREANELARAGEPKSLKRQALALTLPRKWHERAKALAALHHFSDYREWLGQIVQERLEMEERWLLRLENDAANHQNKRRTSKTSVAQVKRRSTARA